MPHAVIDSGSQTTSADFGSRPLIPGVEPGGSRAGRRKPALLIRQADVEFDLIDPDLSAAGPEALTVFLKLSQEQALDPGLILPVCELLTDTQTAVGSVSANIRKNFMAAGTVWAPAWVGGHGELAGGWTAYNVRIHLDYEVIMVDWRDWFVMWEFLDGITNNEREY